MRSRVSRTIRAGGPGSCAAPRGTRPRSWPRRRRLRAGLVAAFAAVGRGLAAPVCWRPRALPALRAAALAARRRARLGRLRAEASCASTAPGASTRVDARGASRVVVLLAAARLRVLRRLRHAASSRRKVAHRVRADYLMLNRAATGAWSESRSAGRPARSPRAPPPAAGAGALDGLEAARPGGGRSRGRGAAEAEALAQPIERPRASLGRRLRSPPSTSGSPAAHSTRGSARRASAPARPGRAGRRSRAGWPRTACAAGQLEPRPAHARGARAGGRARARLRSRIARAAHEDLVRAALAGRDQVGVEVAPAAAARRAGSCARSARARLERGAARRARGASAAAPPGAAPRPTASPRAARRTRRAAAG